MLFAIADNATTGQFFALPIIVAGVVFLIAAGPVSRAVRRQRLRNAERARARLRARRVAGLKRLANGR